MMRRALGAFTMCGQVLTLWKFCLEKSGPQRGGSGWYPSSVSVPQKTTELPVNAVSGVPCSSVDFLDPTFVLLAVDDDIV